MLEDLLNVISLDNEDYKLLGNTIKKLTQCDDISILCIYKSYDGEIFQKRLYHYDDTNLSLENTGGNDLYLYSDGEIIGLVTLKNGLILENHPQSLQIKQLLQIQLLNSYNKFRTSVLAENFSKTINTRLRAIKSNISNTNTNNEIYKVMSDINGFINVIKTVQTKLSTDCNVTQITKDIITILGLSKLNVVTKLENITYTSDLKAISSIVFYLLADIENLEYDLQITEILNTRTFSIVNIILDHLPAPLHLIYLSELLRLVNGKLSIVSDTITISLKLSK